MSNSLTKASYAELVKDRDLMPDASVHMLNPLSSDLGAMRQSLVFQAGSHRAKREPPAARFEAVRIWAHIHPSRQR